MLHYHKVITVPECNYCYSNILTLLQYCNIIMLHNYVMVADCDYHLSVSATHSASLSIHPSIYLSVYLMTYLSIHLK